MSIETIIEETKRRSALLNSLLIDCQYIQQLTPQILNNDNPNSKSTAEFKNGCNALIKIYEKAEEELKELNSLISSFVAE